MQHISQISNAPLPKVLHKVFNTKKSLFYFEYPYIDSAAYKTAMDNFRAFLVKYNRYAALENENIKAYNHLVQAQCKAKRPSNEEIKKLKAFEIRHRRTLVHDYNTEVDAFNKKNGPLAQKKKINRLPIQTEVTFSVILNFYTSQLKERNLLHMELGQSTACYLPRVKLNSHKMTTHKINDEIRLPIHKKTVQRHLKRLREAKVLTGYKYSGPEIPIEAYISPNILTVQDGKKQKSEITEYQSLNIQQRTKRSEVYRDTRSLNNSKKKGNVDNIPNMETSLTLRPCSNKNLDKNTKKKSNSASYSRNFLQDPLTLARELAAHKHDHYRPLPFQIINRIANDAVTTRAEFRLILFQDFLKHLAHLYKDTTPFAGSWMSAYHILNDDFFTTGGDVWHKHTMAKRYEIWRSMIITAKRWFKKTKINPLFPHQYLDPTRKDGKEIGFWYCYKFYKQNARKKMQREERKKEQVRAARVRKEKIDNHRKAVRKIRDFLYGKIEIDTLQRYFETCLPFEYQKHLADMMKAEIDKLNTAIS